MSTTASVCHAYQQLLQELTWARQLCAECEGPSVVPIDERGLTAERAAELHFIAVEQRIQIEARIFIHQCTCLRCLRSPTATVDRSPERT